MVHFLIPDPLWRTTEIYSVETVVSCQLTYAITTARLVSGRDIGHELSSILGQELSSLNE